MHGSRAIRTGDPCRVFLISTMPVAGIQLGSQFEALDIPVTITGSGLCASSSG